MKITKLIRFDWAIKRLLRHKASFDILEGFLSVLLKENIKIRQILDSESNKESEDDKHNRVDILVEDSKGELIIIEVQNSKEYDCFHRILYGTSKVITEHISEEEAYAAVKKVISITIAYFDLGQGQDYVYHGTNVFKGIHKGDTLNLATRQKELYEKEAVYQIFPEYWLLKVGKFDNTIQGKLDEWIYFLKNGEIQESFTAKGLNEAKERLNEMQLSEDERKAYKRYLARLRDIASENHTKLADTQLLIEKAVERAEKSITEKSIIKALKRGKLTLSEIAEDFEVSLVYVQQIKDSLSNT